MAQSPVLCASQLINPADVDIVRTFGNTWRERVGFVRGFRIQTGLLNNRTILFDVKNLFSVAVDNNHRLYATRSNHYFLLLPKEHVVQVDVYAMECCFSTQRNGAVTPGRINALRFHTNERVSEWFGNCDGTMTQLKAPEGHFIQALYGSVNRRFCGQVGVCYAPSAALLDAAVVTEPDLYKLTKVVRGCDATALCFRVQSDQLRAIAVNAENHIVDIAVVTEAQYKAFTALDLYHDCASENWFILAKDERIKAVGVVFQQTRLLALRFRTNYRTSMWFGMPSSGNVTWLDCDESPGAYVCGFHVEGFGITACTQVTGIAAIYKTPSVEGDGKTTAVATASLASKAA